MTSSSGIGASRGDFLRLFEGDSVAGLGDGDLLARFVSRRDEAAFEALVARLGPMVLGVCRRMLADPHDVEDAFQATFLVLVRRGGSIRDRDVVATWLYEVAVRVARRARLDASRRSEREKRGADAGSLPSAGDVHAAADRFRRTRCRSTATRPTARPSAGQLHAALVSEALHRAGPRLLRRRSRRSWGRGPCARTDRRRRRGPAAGGRARPGRVRRRRGRAR